MMMFVNLLGLLLAVSSQAFTPAHNNGLISKPSLSILFVHEHSTSLHVGVSYGPPQMDDDFFGVKSTLHRLRSNNNNNNAKFGSDANIRPSFFEIDPTFSASALSIYYDDSATKADNDAFQRRRMQRSVAASTAVVCSVLLAKGVVTSGVVPYFFSKLPYFYKAYPLQASIATCGINSVVADTISQLMAWKPSEGIYQFEWKQTLSSIVYGSVCLGIGGNLSYTKLLPFLLSGTSGLTTVLGSALLDNAVLAPLLWLPPAYAIKAWFNGESVKKALKGYVHAVRKEKLLHRYASFWMPASLLTFGCVPKHLRVMSTAAFSFLWFLILTKITSSSSSSD